MKIIDIPNNFTSINFVLAKDKRDEKALYELEGRREFAPFHYPENDKHDEECVKWFANIIKYYKTYNVVIHTYNEVFINTIAAWIGLGKLPSNYAKIFIIEGDEVRVSTFTDKGTLENWPFGWFMADSDTIENADLG